MSYIASLFLATYLFAEPPRAPQTGQLIIDQITELHSRELETLNDPKANSVSTDSIHAAKIALRRVTLELAQRTLTANTIRSSLQLAAFRLSVSIPWLDDCFMSFALPTTQVGIPPRPLREIERTQAISAMDRFAKTALETIRRSPISTARELDRTLENALAPLAEIIGIKEQRRPLRHWPTTAQVIHPPQEGNTSSATLPENLTLDSDPFPAIVILREFSRPLNRRLEVYSDDPEAKEDVARATRDLDRIRKTEYWLEIIKESSPSSYMGLLRQLKPLLRMLANDEARTNGAIAIDVILEQFDRYFAMPLHDELLRSPENISMILGGRGPEIHRQISTLRIDWLDEFSRGRTQGDASQNLDRIHRLLTIAEILSPLSLERTSVTESLKILNTWGAWYLPPTTAEWMIRSLVPRIRIAATTTAQGTFEELDVDLDRLERHVPLASLILLLKERLSPLLQHEDSGPPGMIMALTLPPEDGAWMIEQREVLANLCSAVIDILESGPNEKTRSNTELHTFVGLSSTFLINEIKRKTP